MSSRIFDGAEMRRRRRALGINPTELGATIGRCTETVAFYELGFRTPPLSVVCAICDALGCTPNDLVIPQFEAAS
jgi:transcriptional regulator with XRE-family HTH domain